MCTLDRLRDHMKVCPGGPSERQSLEDTTPSTATRLSRKRQRDESLSPSRSSLTVEGRHRAASPSPTPTVSPSETPPLSPPPCSSTAAQSSPDGPPQQSSSPTRSVSPSLISGRRSSRCRTGRRVSQCMHVHVREVCENEVCCKEVSGGQ